MPFPVGSVEELAKLEREEEKRALAMARKGRVIKRTEMEEEADAGS